MTRYVENSKGLWVPDYTVGNGLGTNLARLVHRMGFKQKPGCGCPKKQALLDRWTAAGIEPPMYRGNALPILAGGTGEEAKCASLGANCLCSEPFQMTGFSRISDYLKPNDAPTKGCSTEGVSPGYAILRTTDDLVGSTDSTILAALPAGHSVSRVLKGPEAHEGGWNEGHMLTGSDPVARTSTRWYLYYSSNFTWTEHPTDPGKCNNSEKWMVGSTNNPNNPQSGVHEGGGSNGALWHFYAWPGWTPQLDCCPNGGPGYNSAGVRRSALLGRWWRFEVVVRNRNSAGLIFEAYLKNVTDNGAVIKIIDSTIPCVGCGNDPGNDWTVASGATTTLTPPATYKETRTEHFRNTLIHDGACTGFNAVSHLMVAAWDTDDNQFIGAATEIEGGDGGGIITPGKIFNMGRRIRR